MHPVDGKLQATAERLIQGGILLLPLLCWPGLEHPFSTPKTWLLACLDLAIVSRCLFRGPGARETRDWPLLIWLAAPALSAVAAPYVSLETLLLAVLPLPLCWAARREQLSVGGLKQAILYGSSLLSAVVVLQYCNLDPLKWLGWQTEVFGSRRMRVYGTLGNPDFVAAWLCATLPLYAGVLERGRKKIALVALALQLGAILATGSRVFLLTLPLAAAVLAICRMRAARWWLAGLPVAAALLWFSPARPLGATIQGRVYLLRVAAGHLREIPPAGYGPGAFRLQAALWQAGWLREHGNEPDTRQFAGEFDHAHNDYLELWVDYGPAGLCAFLGLCGWLICTARRRGLKDASAWDGEICAGIACLAAVACVDFPFHRPAEWGLFWLLMGMLGSRVSARPPERSDVLNRQGELQNVDLSETAHVHRSLRAVLSGALPCGNVPVPGKRGRHS